MIDSFPDSNTYKCPYILKQIYQIISMSNTMFIILFTVFVSSQVHAVRGLAEPEGGCPSDLRLMYTFMDDKFTLKDEIKQLKVTLDELKNKVANMEIERKGNN